MAKETQEEKKEKEMDFRSDQTGKWSSLSHRQSLPSSTPHHIGPHQDISLASSSSHDCRRDGQVQSRMFCHCGKLSPIVTSKTIANPGRRFYGCGNYFGSSKSCGFFSWIDEELPPHDKEFRCKLIKENGKLIEENRKLKKANICYCRVLHFFFFMTLSYIGFIYFV